MGQIGFKIKKLIQRLDHMHTTEISTVIYL